MSARVPAEASTATARRSAQVYPYLVFAPLVERFRLGEGLLLAINATIVAFQGPAFAHGAWQLVFSAVVLAALYSFNDLIDCQADRHNPKKNQRLVSALIENEREFTLFLYGLKVGLVLAAWPLLGAVPAAVIAGIFAVNMLYSLRVKGMPFADILLVGVWGGLYTAIADTPVRICALVGMMTTVSHVFQILVDRDVDAGNRVQTTAVFSLPSTTAMLGGMCVALALALYEPLGYWGLTALVPFAAHVAITRNETAWMVSRVYFAVVLLVVLGVANGHL